MSSSPIGTRRVPGAFGDGEGGEPQRIVGSPGLGPSVEFGAPVRGGNPFDSRLNRAVSTQIAAKLIGTIALMRI